MLNSGLLLKGSLEGHFSSFDQRNLLSNGTCSYHCLLLTQRDGLEGIRQVYFSKVNIFISIIVLGSKDDLCCSCEQLMLTSNKTASLLETRKGNNNKRKSCLTVSPTGFTGDRILVDRQSVRITISDMRVTVRATCCCCRP